MSELRIIHEKCTLCERCVKACPFDALRVCDGLLRVGEECVLCGACVKICPEAALEVEEPVRSDSVSDLRRWRGVWVVVELSGEESGAGIVPVSCELIGRGRRLADALSTELSVVVMGHGLDHVAGDLCRFPLDRIYIVDHEELKDFISETHAAVLSELAGERKPEILLCGATANGRAFFPRTAALLHTGLTADCTGLEVDSRRRVLLQTRPAFGGNVMATIECPEHRPQMATVRPGVMARPDPGDARDVEVVAWQPSGALGCRRVQLLRKTVQQEGGANLSEADVIVAGGGGVGGAEGFEIIAELARALGGVVGASRAAVDSGWAPYAAQIGQTGRVVQPRLYVACGISGAVQHLVGMQSAETIVAINSDPGAPIFEVADFGFVGDLRAVIPRLIRTIEDDRRKKSR